jgi:hypothetical protein
MSPLEQAAGPRRVATAHDGQTLAVHPDMLARAVCRADSVSRRVVVGRSTDSACAESGDCRVHRLPLTAVRLAGRAG